MKISLVAFVVLLFTTDLHAGVSKSFRNGYILCVFDKPSTMINQGSKLVVVVQNPTTHHWAAPPLKDDRTSPQWPHEFVETHPSSDEVDSDGTLVIKKPVTVAFCNF